MSSISRAFIADTDSKVYAFLTVLDTVSCEESVKRLDLELLVAETGRRIEGKGKEGSREYDEVRCEKRMERGRRDKRERKYVCNVRRLFRHWWVRVEGCQFLISL